MSQVSKDERALLEKLSLYIEKQLNDPNILIRWFSGAWDRFVIIYSPNLDKTRYEGSNILNIYFDSNIKTEELTIAEFYERYNNIIKDSQHYIEFMSYILGSHV